MNINVDKCKCTSYLPRHQYRLPNVFISEHKKAICQPLDRFSEAVSKAWNHITSAYSCYINGEQILLRLLIHSWNQYVTWTYNKGYYQFFPGRATSIIIILIHIPNFCCSLRLLPQPVELPADATCMRSFTVMSNAQPSASLFRSSRDWGYSAKRNPSLL